MTFWRSETMRGRLPAEQLIEPYHEENVKHGAYELGMGPEAFITSTTEKKKKTLADGEPLVIPSGQFALLLTEEQVTVPLNAIAFISMKFGVKRRGLINVSGFHVDPGFTGRLKFSVYNAGGSDITITRRDRVFLVWYANLDAATEDGYSRRTPQDSITSDDQNVMHGEVASPAELKSRLDELKHFDVHRKWLLGVVAVTFVGILVRLMFMQSSATEVEQLRTDIMAEVRMEISQAVAKQGDHPNPIAQTETASTVPPASIGSDE